MGECFLMGHGGAGGGLQITELGTRSVQGSRAGDVIADGGYFDLSGFDYVYFKIVGNIMIKPYQSGRDIYIGLHVGGDNVPYGFFRTNASETTRETFDLISPAFRRVLYHGQKSWMNAYGQYYSIVSQPDNIYCGKGDANPEAFSVTATQTAYGIKIGG